MLQDYSFFPIRSSLILTAAYVAGTILGPTNGNPALRNQLNLLVAFTIGSLTDASIKIEFSHDGLTYFQDSFEAIAAGVSTISLGTYKFTASGNYVINVPVKYNYIKISAIGNGTATSSLMAIDAILGTV